MSPVQEGASRVSYQHFLLTDLLIVFQEDHLPKTCEEMDLDKKLNGLHQVEEAMTEALIRKCPKCSEPFVKESGCNKYGSPLIYILLIKMLTLGVS